MPSPSTSAIAQRPDRRHVFLGAEIVSDGAGLSTKHRIKDLSEYGARIDGAKNLSAGSVVRMSIGAVHAIDATVIWIDGDAAGLRFEKPIDLEAARSKAMLAPSSFTPPKMVSGEPSPTAGWAADLKNPYRRNDKLTA